MRGVPPACQEDGSLLTEQLGPEGKCYAGALVPAEVRAVARAPESAALASRSRVSGQRVEHAKAPARAVCSCPRESATPERLSQRRSELLSERRNRLKANLVAAADLTVDAQ
jgi:hypothetical protein